VLIIRLPVVVKVLIALDCELQEEDMWSFSFTTTSPVPTIVW
jgi:hypothetical protein